MTYDVLIFEVPLFIALLLAFTFREEAFNLTRLNNFGPAFLGMMLIVPFVALHLVVCPFEADRLHDNHPFIASRQVLDEDMHDFRPRKADQVSYILVCSCRLAV